MSFLGKILAAGKSEAPTPAERPHDSSLTDGALDTLGCVIRTMGDVSFPLADESNSDAFEELCGDFACHIEYGGPVPTLDIEQSLDGQRQWSNVRRFFIDRRTDEKAFVTKRLGDYRGVVQNLLDGLRQIGQRDQDTEQAVLENLKIIEDAVDSGIWPEVRIALNMTMQNIDATFVRQKQEYEAQISDLNERMSSLREDLVAVQEEMKRDSLTDAFNRGAFDTAIAKSINMHIILKQPLTLLMIDLDNFKAINDTYGHSSGDEVLKLVGECLARSFIRRSDFVARYGGDEFAVILSDTNAEYARPLVERCLASIAALNVPVASEAIEIACSVGYTELHEHDSVRALVERADAALYEAKAAGRNCFRCAPQPKNEHRND